MPVGDTPSDFVRTSSWILQTAREHEDSAALTEFFSPLQVSRRAWIPSLPQALRTPVTAVETNDVMALGTSGDAEILRKLFPATSDQKFLTFEAATDSKLWQDHPPLRIGVVLSGGQAPGGHNVIAGIFDYVKQCNANSQCFGFLNGPHGIFTHNYKEVDSDFMSRFRNQGGFDMICSGRHKIETEEQKAASMAICKKLDLHGLVVIGGDDSNTNAAILAEYFKSHGCSTCVVGVPKTIDGDLKNEYCETSFGFDTATKVYSELIGNLMTDVATSKNRYHFVRLMGRSASNIALECALQTRPNLTFIGEEVLFEKRSLASIVAEIVELVCKRQDSGKNYGVILLPEGLIEFIPEVGTLISEINDILAHGDFDVSKLTPHSQEVFNLLPEQVRLELLLERDPHGNVQVAKIATEKLLILMTMTALESEGRADRFTPTAHYFGYEGRCAMPSNFDASYCYSLGHTAAGLVDCGRTGYMAVLRNLSEAAEQWTPAGCPLTFMMNIERRKGKDVPVIKKYIVDLEDETFKLFCKVREDWKCRDVYRNPGPIQFSGPCADSNNYTIAKPTIGDVLPPLPFNVEQMRSRFNFIKSEAYLSPLQRDRLRSRVDVARVLSNPSARVEGGARALAVDQLGQKFVNRAFPLQCNEHRLRVVNVTEDSQPARSLASPVSGVEKGLRVGIVLCGQQSPGISNVVHGLWDRMRITGGEVFGFLGITGLLEKKYIEVTKEDLKLHYNQGGFEMLGRTKETKSRLRTDKGLQQATESCVSLKLDGLVMIGGQTSLTDCAVLTEHLLQKGVKTRVIGVPATQENNMSHPMVECPIGFDSTSKCYAALIGNLLTDAASATKYWYFVRLMGQVPSHNVLESALQTHPNMTVISEKYADSDNTLQDVVRDVADVICRRAEAGKNFGTVLIPEGLTQQLPGMKQLVGEIDSMLKNLEPEDYPKLHQDLVLLKDAKSTYASQLTPWSRALLMSLPEFFRKQLLHRTQSGRIELPEVSVEQLISHMVSEELRVRKTKGLYLGTFSPVCHYLGFQGRSTLPSAFDCALGLSHGYLAGILVEAGMTGYLTTVRGLCGPSENWRMSGVPIVTGMKVLPERELMSYGRQVPMVPVSEVDLRGRPYAAFASAQEQWEMEDRFCNPGPMQFDGRAKSFYNRTLFEEHHHYLQMLHQVAYLTEHIEQVCTFGVDEPMLRTAVYCLEVCAHSLRAGPASAHNY